MFKKPAKISNLSFYGHKTPHSIIIIAHISNNVKHNQSFRLRTTNFLRKFSLNARKFFGA